MKSEHRPRYLIAFDLEVGLTDRTSGLFVLLANKGGEGRATHTDRVGILNSKLRLDLRRSERRGKVICELRDIAIRCLGRREQTRPALHLVARIACFNHCRDV